MRAALSGAFHQAALDRSPPRRVTQSLPREFDALSTSDAVAADRLGRHCPVTSPGR
jgi:hypothetical protein